MTDCYLHVGTKKTGSTAIQAFLHAKREELLARGLLVPRSGMGPNGKHGFLARAASGLPLPRKYENLLTDLSNELACHPELPVLVSDEGLERDFKLRRPCEVVAFFKQRGYRICVLGFVRPQPARINASYVQVVKTFCVNSSFRDFAQHAVFGGWLFYSRWLRIAREQGLDLRLLPYDAAAREHGVFPSFLRALGIEDVAPKATEDYRRNATVGTAAIAAARTCMDRLAERGLQLNTRQRTPCEMALAEADRAHPTPPFFGLTPAQVVKVEDCYWGDNQYLARAVWGRDWEDVFGASASAPAPNELNREDASAPGHQEYAAILDRVWPEVLRVAEDPKLSRPAEWDMQRRTAV